VSAKSIIAITNKRGDINSCSFVYYDPECAAFGLAGSILVDIYGVRTISIAALSVAIVGRTLLAFGRTKGALYLALFLFSPCGDALLSVGLYKVALKKLTTPLTRPLGFALSYSTFNLAGAIADILVDKMRAGVEDLNVDSHFIGVGGVYTPIRQFVVSVRAGSLQVNLLSMSDTSFVRDFLYGMRRWLLG
jgi:hypothetical protein